MTWSDLTHSQKVAAKVASLAILLYACGSSLDADGDGFFKDDSLCGTAVFDCDDSNRAQGNGAIVFYDCDGDGLGDNNNRYYVCEEVCPGEPLCPVVSNNVDCDDRVEVGSDTGAGVPLFPDCDNDGYGDTNRSDLYCESIDGQNVPELDANGCTLVATSSDCDDTDGDVSSGILLFPDCDRDGVSDCFPAPLMVCPASAETHDLTTSCDWLTAAPVGCSARPVATEVRR